MTGLSHGSLHRGLRQGASHRTGALALVALLVLAAAGNGCRAQPREQKSQAGSATPAPSRSAARGTTATSPSAPPSGPVPRLDLEAIRVRPTDPIAAVALPRGEGLVVAERAGRVRVLDLSGAEPRLSGPAIDISADVSTDMERGLLGLAFSPRADRLFLSYTNRAGNSRLDSYAVEWATSAGAEPHLVVDTGSRREILAVEQPYANHNGGHIEFGPDGMLYYGLGDGGAADDPHGNGQNRSTLLGKLLRLDPERNGGEGPAAADNPFSNTPGARPEIWATGLRNPWRFSFDPANGDLWIADVGQDRIEEIDRVTQAEGGGRGANFGWDLYEGEERFAHPNPAPAPASAGPFVEPVFIYEHNPGCSVTGGVVYRGAISGLVGRYLFTDFCDGRIRALTPNSDGSVSESDLGIAVPQAVGFAADTKGEVYVISLSDGLYRITAAS